MRAMRLVLCLMAISVVGQTARAQSVTARGPVISVRPGIVDLGQMPQESVRRSQTAIFNTGTDSLRITDIKSECGCTVPDVHKRVLAPGDSTLLKITFSSRHYHGNILKRVTVSSNDPASPQTRIKVKVKVLELMSVRPVQTHFGNVRRGSTPSRTVTFKAAREDSLRIEEVLMPEELFTYVLEPIDEPDSTGFRLVATIKPDAPLGPISTRPGIKNNLTKQPWVLYFKGHVHGFFRAKPTRVSLGRFKAGVIKTATIRLEGQGEGHHRLLQATCSLEQLAVHVDVIEEGRIYEITVTAGPDIPAGQIREELRIETDDPSQPEIILPVRASVKA